MLVTVVPDGGVSSAPGAYLEISIRGCLSALRGCHVDELAVLADEMVGVYGVECRSDVQQDGGNSQYAR